MGGGTQLAAHGKLWIGCLTTMLTALASQAAVATVLSGQAVRPAARENDHTLVAAEDTLHFSVKDIEAEPGSDTAIHVDLPSSAELRAADAEQTAFLLIRNIPEGVSISPGMATGRIRVVPLRDASTLRLLTKPDMHGQFQLEFYLIGRYNRAIGRTTATVTFRPRQTGGTPTASRPLPETPTAAIQALPQPEPLAPKADAPPSIQPRPKAEPPTANTDAEKPSTRSRPEAEPLTPEAEAILLARGKEVLQQGGIAAARIIFEEMATHGSAAGAFALAQSYDPAVIASSAASAPAPDIEKARKWYERAAELGNADAKRRLAEIASGR